MKSIILVDNCYSYLHTDNEKLKIILWKALRFREKGYFHSRLYKQKKWDGFRDFFSKETGRFLTGLLPEVESALKIMGIEYEVRDNRSKVEFVVDKIDENYLKDINPHPEKDFILQDYQVDYTNQTIKYGRGVIFAPTSAGKSAVMMAIVKAIKSGTPTLILLNKKGLADQIYSDLAEWGFKNIGRLYDKYSEPNIITVALIQSLHKIVKLLPKIKVLIVDEIHEMMSKRTKKCYNVLKAAAVRVALSATPFKFGGTDKCQKYSVKGYFGPVFKTTSSAAEDGVLKTKKLQERGRLSKAHCIFYPITHPQLPYAIYQDAITHGIEQNWDFHQIVNRLARKQKGRTLIIVDRIAHGDYLKQLIPEALWIQGKDDTETRKYVINQLTTSKENVIAIATQGIFNTGINVFVNNLINAASGQAEHVIIQRFGRGLRVASDKDILHYYDFVFLINDYLKKHSKSRVKVLKKEGHNVEVMNEIDF